MFSKEETIASSDLELTKKKKKKAKKEHHCLELE